YTYVHRLWAAQKGRGLVKWRSNALHCFAAFCITCNPIRERPALEMKLEGGWMITWSFFVPHGEGMEEAEREREGGREKISGRRSGQGQRGGGGGGDGGGPRTHGVCPLSSQSTRSTVPRNQKARSSVGASSWLVFGKRRRN